MKQKNIKAKVLWFNLAKGYGQLIDEKGKHYMLFGWCVGGDKLYGMNIPKNRRPENGDEYHILKREKADKKHTFYNDIDFVAIKVRRVRKAK